MSDYKGRIARLQAAMRERKAALTVLAVSDQMRYLAGWAEPGHERLIALFVPAEGEPAFLIPSINAQHAQANPAGIEKVIGWNDATGWHDEATTLLSPYLKEGDEILIDDELHSVHLLGLQSLLPEMRYTPAGATMAQLRQIKADDELAALERAATLIDTIYEESLASLTQGMTEREFQAVIFAALQRHGTTPSFTPLICFGANGAMPHHAAGGTRLQPGDVVIIDIGCICDGYCSDITRTVAFGPPSDPDAARVYEIVSEAHWAARHAIQPGVSGEIVDAMARAVIIEAGYGPQFLHRTGHGIGLSAHESPYIVAGNAAPLQPGMCFSVEPGVYLPGRFGVRIENIVTVTTDGARSLNAEAPKTLRIVGA